MSITAEEIERRMKEFRVDSIFPEITIENDPWNAGGVVSDAGESAWHGDDSCHNNHIQPRFNANSRYNNYSYYPVQEMKL